jgi:hypothetical protein
MYRRKCKEQLEFKDFYLPFGGKLDRNNRWIKLSELIPWGEIEEIYREHFSPDNGAPAKPLRMALGALIIKERCGFTDEETVEQIKENPYLQYFIGMSEYSSKAPFEASMMVHFRKRLDAESMSEINDIITGVKRDKHSDDKSDDDKDGPDSDKKGKLLVDATCTPADVRYPTDMSLLDEARTKTEKMIDALCSDGKKKPRTYRKKARKEFVRFIHLKKPDGKKVRKAIRKQLGYVARNLKNIEKISDSKHLLSEHQKKELFVIQDLYRQQKEMYDAGNHSVKSRIVSISQPHVRPIVRGKAGAPVEFGAKIELAYVEGYAFIDYLSWENFNESGKLIDQINSYKRRYGYYPESVHADKIFRTRENRNFCKDRGIRLSGPSLGRPSKMSREEKRQALNDERVRNAIEGKFGQGKRRFGLSRIKAKLQETSEAVIWINIIVMNLDRKLALYFLRFIYRVTARLNFELLTA